MNLPILGRLVGERFLNYRLRSTSLAGMVGGVVAVLLFAYRFYINGIWSWDLLAVGLTFVVVKLAMMAWYFLTD
jgi:hypothetical protein